jgi:hypothetical protein
MPHPSHTFSTSNAASQYAEPAMNMKLITTASLMMEAEKVSETLDVTLK